MKAIRSMPTVLTVLAVMGLVAVLVQQRGLAALRERKENLVRAATVGAPAVAAPSVPTETRPATGTSLTDAERVELMRLRSQVTDLRERQRGAGAISNRNVQLQARLSSLTNLAKGAFPAGWVRRQDARMAGFATPQAAFESFVWGMAHGDTNVLFQSFGPKSRALMEHMVANGKLEEMLKGGEQLPGFLIRGVRNEPDGTVKLDVEFVPGAGGPGITARLWDGAWRIEM